MLEGDDRSRRRSHVAESEENRFLEVTYANGDKEVLFFKDFNSGAMIQNIVDRAKKYAIKSVLDTGAPGLRVQHLFDSIVDEFAENEDLPTPPILMTGHVFRARRVSGSSTSALSSRARTPVQAARSTRSRTRASTCSETNIDRAGHSARVVGPISASLPLTSLRLDRSVALV